MLGLLLSFIAGYSAGILVMCLLAISKDGKGE